MPCLHLNDALFAVPYLSTCLHCSLSIRSVVVKCLSHSSRTIDGADSKSSTTRSARLWKWCLWTSQQREAIGRQSSGETWAATTTTTQNDDTREGHLWSGHGGWVKQWFDVHSYKWYLFGCISLSFTFWQMDNASFLSESLTHGQFLFFLFLKMKIFVILALFGLNSNK